MLVFFFKQKTAYEMRISDWSSDVCSSDLPAHRDLAVGRAGELVGVVELRELFGGQRLGHAFDEVHPFLRAPLLGDHRRREFAAAQPRQPRRIDHAELARQHLRRAGRDAGAVHPLVQLGLADLARMLVEQVLLRVIDELHGGDALEREVVEVAAQEGVELLRSEEHTSELQSLMRISYAVFCLKKKNSHINNIHKSILLTTTNIYRRDASQYRPTTNHTR